MSLNGTTKTASHFASETDQTNSASTMHISVAKQFGVDAAIGSVAVGSLPLCVCLAVAATVPLTSHRLAL